MADIDQIIASGAKTNADFGGIAGIADSYWKGLDQNFKQRNRDAFKDGVPMKDGQVDIQEVMKTLFKNGDVGNAVGLIGASNGMQDRALLAGIDRPPQETPSAPSAPPSPSRNSGVPVAPPMQRGPQSAPSAAIPNAPYKGSDAPGSIVGLVSAAGVPDELAGPIIQQVSASTRTDPNAPLNPDIAPRVQQVVTAAAQRMRSGGQAAQPQQMPQAAPSSSVQADTQNDPILKRLTVLAASPNKETAAAAQIRLKSYLEAKQPTTEQKNAAAAGMTTREYIDRNDAQTTERAVLTNSILPKLDKSQEQATAARDEIQAINRAREQLDAPGGIVSGRFANEAQMMNKIGTFFGLDKQQVANTETFSAAIGARVLSLVKGLGSGAGITDADREFAAAMAGGNIKLDEKSIRRILDLGEKAARVRIKQHNSLVGRTVKANDALSAYSDTYNVQEPSAYQRAAPSFQDGATATNKATGQRMIFKSGKWEPLS